MLSRLFAFFSNRRIRNRAAAEQRDFQMLNALAPVKDADPAGVATMQTEHGDPAGSAAARSVICREAVLNREQRVAGYEFMLRGKIHEQMRMPNRRPHYRFYNEVMINQDVYKRQLRARAATVRQPGQHLAQCAQILNSRLNGSQVFANQTVGLMTGLLRLVGELQQRLDLSDAKTQFAATTDEA